MVAGKSLAYFNVVTLRRSQNDTRSSGCKIWRTDGTKNGTYALTDCDVGQSNPPQNPYPSYGFYEGNGIDSEITITRNNEAVFKKVNWRTDRIELWKTNGTRASTRLVRSFPYVRIAGRVNPESMRIDLRRAGKYIWYKSYARNRRHTVSVSDLSLSDTKRIMVGRPNAVINLMGYSDHILIQQVYNSANFNNINSALYRVDADGSGLSRITYGRRFLPGRFNGDANFRIATAVTIGNQVLLPFKPLKRSRELLLAHNLDSGETVVRRRFTEPTGSSMRGSYLMPGPNDTAWFCANNGDTVRWQLGSKTRLWTSDGTGSNTRAVISDVDARVGVSRDYPFIRSQCGQFVFSANRIVYINNTASLGEELWTAKLDGSDRKPLLDLKPGKASSYPRQMVATRSGVIFSAIPGRQTGNREEYWLPKNLIHVDRSGDHEILLEAFNIKILNKAGDRVWFRTGTKLGITDGTANGTRIVMAGIAGAKVVELDGDTYLVIRFSDSVANPPALYRLAANARRPVLVGRLESGSRFQTPEPAQMIAYQGQIYLSQGNPAQKIYRYDPVTGDALKVVDLETASSPFRFIKSMAVFNDSIYTYVDVTSASGTDGSWEIWRSGGEPGDSVAVHRETAAPPRSGFLFDRESMGILTASESSLWFMARDRVHGTELWQLKPD